MDTRSACYTLRRFDPDSEHKGKLSSGQKYTLEFPEGSAELREVFDLIRCLAGDAFRRNVFPVTVRVRQGSQVADHKLLRHRDESTSWESTVISPTTSTPREGSKSVGVRAPSSLRTIPKQVPNVVNTVRNLNKIEKIKTLQIIFKIVLFSPPLFHL